MLQSLYLALFWILNAYPIHLPSFIAKSLKSANTTLHTLTSFYTPNYRVLTQTYTLVLQPVYATIILSITIHKGDKKSC